jgi:hypothetical protein
VIPERGLEAAPRRADGLYGWRFRFKSSPASIRSNISVAYSDNVGSAGGVIAASRSTRRDRFMSASQLCASVRLANVRLYRLPSTWIRPRYDGTHRHFLPLQPRSWRVSIVPLSALTTSLLSAVRTGA